MKGDTTQPKVFVSYSWTSPSHEQWVLELAERLSSDGIIVILDKWDLKEGQDKHVFMEQMVHDQDIKKVLIICDHGYQEKADDRKGGVGTETQLISKEVYENTAQEKFIPIVREYDKESKPCIPHYIASRIYIDFSSDKKFEEEYQKLIRNLYDKPLLKRPTLGTPPAYVVEEGQSILKTSHGVELIKNALLNDRRSANGLTSDYFDRFISSLEEFRISGGSAEGFDDKVISSIEKMLPLRDDFIDFVFTVFKYQESVNLDQFQSFFEQLIPFCNRPENVQTYTNIDYDNYKFFNYELVLYFIAILLKLKKYKGLAHFLNAQYFYRHPNSSELIYNGIEIFNNYCESLDRIRNARMKLSRVSITADLIKARSTRKDINFNELMQADLILYYITELHSPLFSWFPRTSVYNMRGSGVELFDRLISRQHFEKIKEIFDTKSTEQLKKGIADYIDRNKDRQRRYSGIWDYDIRPLEKVIDPNKIGTIQ